MRLFKEYIINLAPISWKRPGINKKTFYDQQKHEKLAFGLYLLQQHGDDPKFTKPLHVEVNFFIPIPDILKKREHSRWCAKYPDIDNLQKFIFDAINDTGVIWNDDRLISSLVCKKIYDKCPRTHITITELT
jgi:Holliday junction resolvase RusA-like endonuclease